MTEIQEKQFLAGSIGRFLGFRGCPAGGVWLAAFWWGFLGSKKFHQGAKNTPPVGCFSSTTGSFHSATGPFSSTKRAFLGLFTHFC